MHARAFAFLRDLAASEAVRVRVRGDCMAPLIAAGTEVSVRRRALYLPGDVIVFRTTAGDLAAHRVLGYRAKGIVTKGDRCSLHDAPVARAQVVGAVEALAVGGAARLRALGRFAAIVARRLGR
ncbi:MAG TPA: S24/S26 family peptidase [Thermoanaerobaculia bacterium]|nr:S24/S26 family peptidase [Thermoanaerobaculia bacterium]